MSKSDGKSVTDSQATLSKLRECIGVEADLLLLIDHRTGAKFCECQIDGQTLTSLGTTDTPLDPDDQSEYRANRELVENAPAFARMKEDALNRRSFSGIVLEFVPDDPQGKPLKVVGGQHRFVAVEGAFIGGVNELHGVKIYLDLTMEQRFDAQLISNTVIAVARDLYDRMLETMSGPQLRNWCQDVGLLAVGEDFADTRIRGGTLTVQAARTFIMAYMAGTAVELKKFGEVDTTPIVAASGTTFPEWDKLKAEHPTIWTDPKLRAAGSEYARLIAAQRAAFSGAKAKVPIDFPDKAGNVAILSAWAYVAGVIKDNQPRLKKHYALADEKGKDPLRADLLASGKHRTDPANYRGLGYRTDAKERGRFAELFFQQAEEGGGITKALVTIAIAKYHAKIAALEAARVIARARAKA